MDRLKKLQEVIRAHGHGVEAHALIGSIIGVLLGVLSGTLIVAISGKQWFLLFGTIPDQMIALGTMGALIGSYVGLACNGRKRG